MIIVKKIRIKNILLLGYALFGALNIVFLSMFFILIHTNEHARIQDLSLRLARSLETEMLLNDLEGLRIVSERLKAQYNLIDIGFESQGFYKCPVIEIGCWSGNVDIAGSQKTLVVKFESGISNQILYFGTLFLLISFLMFLVFIKISEHYFEKPLVQLVLTNIPTLKKIAGGSAAPSLHSPVDFRIQELQLVYNELEAMAVEIAQQNSHLNESKSRILQKELLGRVAQNLAHDIRTPLMCIEKAIQVQNWVEFLEYKKPLKSAFYRLNSMIDALKKSDFEVLVQIASYQFDFESISDEFKVIAADKNKSIKSIIDVQTQNIYCDKAKLERAIGCLILNALEADSKQVEVKICTEEENLVILVQDDGTGVPAAYLDELFKRGASFGKLEGTGLGLEYAQSVARGHGGEVTYERIGGKTQFKIEIPNAINASSKKYIGIYLDSPEKQKQFIDAAGQNVELNNITFELKKISECVLIYSNSLDLMDDCLRYKCTYIHAGQGDDIDMIFKKLQYQYLFLTKKTLNQESFV